MGNFRTELVTISAYIVGKHQTTFRFRTVEIFLIYVLKNFGISSMLELVVKKHKWYLQITNILVLFDGNSEIEFLTILPNIPRFSYCIPVRHWPLFSVSMASKNAYFSTCLPKCNCGPDAGRCFVRNAVMTIFWPDRYQTRSMFDASTRILLNFLIK